MVSKDVFLPVPVTVQQREKINTFCKKHGLVRGKLMADLILDYIKAVKEMEVRE